jgi:hypothetical protein
MLDSDWRNRPLDSHQQTIKARNATIDNIICTLGPEIISWLWNLINRAGK